MARFDDLRTELATAQIDHQRLRRYIEPFSSNFSQSSFSQSARRRCEDGCRDRCFQLYLDVREARKACSTGRMVSNAPPVMWAGVTLKLKIEAFEPVGLGVPDGLNAAALENSFGRTGARGG